MIRILICGALGKMGANLLELLQGDTEACAVCGVDSAAPESLILPESSESAQATAWTHGVPVYKTFAEVAEAVDVVIDFSAPAVLGDLLGFAEERGIGAVLATTGYTEADLAKIEAASARIPVFRTANFSIGITLLMRLVREAAAFLGKDYDIEVIERHHNKKKDAPSGTALMLAESARSAFDGEKPFVFGREGMVGARGEEIGIHAVRGGTIVGEHEVMFAGEDEVITVTHSARSKRVFAVGAIRAAKFLVGKPAGKYDMNDILE